MAGGGLKEGNRRLQAISAAIGGTTTERNPVMHQGTFRISDVVVPLAVAMLGVLIGLVTLDAAVRSSELAPTVAQRLPPR